ncbi:MAG: hypothetical protein WB798_07890 [Nocardioidaceae bacterium]
MSLLYGMDRRVVFENIEISIVWLTLIVAGTLVAAVLRRASDPILTCRRRASGLRSELRSASRTPGSRGGRNT